MKRFSLLALTLPATLAVGVIAGHASASSQEQETNYMVVQEFEIGPDQTINEAIEGLSEWVRVFRNSGKHSSARLFMHEWGSEAALYIISETSDWGAIGTLFEDLVAADPGFMDRSWGFVGHSDEILMEIPVQ